MDIRKTMDECDRIARAHGFEARGKEIFPEKLMLIVSELAEALEELRAGQELTAIYYPEPHTSRPAFPGSPKPEGIPIELADAVIRIFDLCSANGIDLEEALRLKMAYNETRPWKHGKTL